MNSIRIITKEDLKMCAELYVKVFNGEPWNDQWTLEGAYKRLADIYDSPNFVGLLYEEKNNINGACFGNCEQWYEGMHYSLKEMFVDTELQGKGIGTRIIKSLETRLREYDVHTIVLFTSKGNNTSEFYINNNFNELSSMSMMAKEIGKGL